ncbi:MAG TPA: hypothetical protein VGR07_10170 [Thermoanaerobaculia bacterium]|jgi:hypothetical protein|nr:hypothetical protein [Thermoanaerobaculia bacterium]
MRAKLRLAAVLVTAGALLGSCRRPAFLGGSPDAGHQPVVCEGRYALCIAAACTPIPSWNAQTGKMQTTRALCECVVANGPSLGDLPCAARAPQGDGRFLVSTYSFGETATHPTMTCVTGTPWASCYDQPCVVDPKDSSKAQCTCPVRTTGEYQTLGGSCDKSKCGTLWSAATPEAMQEAGKLLAGGEGLKAVPANSCP